MAAFEAARFNHSRTSPRRENSWLNLFYQEYYISRQVVGQFEKLTH
jgi:hypothetical protein